MLHGPVLGQSPVARDCCLRELSLKTRVPVDLMIDCNVSGLNLVKELCYVILFSCWCSILNSNEVKVCVY